MKVSINKGVSFIMVSLFLLAACSSQAASINVNSEGVAIKGYDTVAYFTQGRPIPGNKEFHHMWENAMWFFSSQEHLKLFQDNPVKYAPQYGGF